MRIDREEVLRADLHVHSWHSGRAGHFRFLKARDCYSDPEAVYRAAKMRGMDIVTITDHDSIDGCLEFLDRHPNADDFFISEEIECRVPDVDLKIHIGAYDITERIHQEIHLVRRNVFEALAYLRSEGIFYSLNHPFFFFNDQIALADYVDFARRYFPALEVRNGTMLPAHNQLAEAIVVKTVDSGAPLIGIGGSDSHSLAGIGTTFTETPGSTREHFLANLRAGRARPGGRHGGVWRGATEIYRVVGSYWAALVGMGRQDLSWRRRLIGLSFSAVTMPFEFSPLVVAGLQKYNEARRAKRYRQQWASAHLAHTLDHPRMTDDLLMTPNAAEPRR